MNLNHKLLQFFGFLIYLSIGFVFIFIIMLGNIRVYEQRDPLYACRSNPESAMLQEMADNKKLMLSVNKGDLTSIRFTLEQFGMTVEKVSMTGNGSTMTFNITPQYQNDIGYRLCAIKDTLAVNNLDPID